MIFQQAVKHLGGTFLITLSPENTIQYGDAKGQIIRFSGGNDYLKRSKEFPGAGCEDYTLTDLDSEGYIREKLLITTGMKWLPIKDLSLEELEKVETQLLISSLQKEVIKYWIEQKRNE